MQGFVSDELQLSVNNSPVVTEPSLEDNVSVGGGPNVPMLSFGHLVAERCPSGHASSLPDDPPVYPRLCSDR